MERDNQTNRGRGSGITAGEWLRVYISGPITLGDKACNLDQANKAHLELMRRRYAVMNPILTMMIPGAVDIPHQDWLDSDFAWIEHAHAVLRLPGVSDGADKEVAFAKSRGIPVFTSIEQLEDWRREMLESAEQNEDVLAPNEAPWITEKDCVRYEAKWMAEDSLVQFSTGAVRSSDAEGVRYVSQVRRLQLAKRDARQRAAESRHSAHLPVSGRRSVGGSLGPCGLELAGSLPL